MKLLNPPRRKPRRNPTDDDHRPYLDLPPEDIADLLSQLRAQVLKQHPGLSPRQTVGVFQTALRSYDPENPKAGNYVAGIVTGLLNYEQAGTP